MDPCPCSVYPRSSSRTGCAPAARRAAATPTAARLGAACALRGSALMELEDANGGREAPEGGHRTTAGANPQWRRRPLAGARARDYLLCSCNIGTVRGHTRIGNGKKKKKKTVAARRAQFR
eukprot:3378567-Prymnesium_polylepis.1